MAAVAIWHSAIGVMSIGRRACARWTTREWHNQSLSNFTANWLQDLAKSIPVRGKVRGKVSPGSRLPMFHPLVVRFASRSARQLKGVTLEVLGFGNGGQNGVVGRLRIGGHTSQMPAS